MNLESCPSWPKEHDWKSCNRSKPVRGFESLALRQNEKQVARPAFCFGKTKRGIRTRREQTCRRKKTVRWTVFADVVKERSDAKAHGSAPKKSRLYVNSWGKKPQKMKRSKGSGRKVAALNYENICKMRFLNLLKLEYP